MFINKSKWSSRQTKPIPGESNSPQREDLSKVFQERQLSEGNAREAINPGRQMKGKEHQPSRLRQPLPPAVPASSLIFSSGRERNHFNVLKTLPRKAELGGTSNVISVA